MNSGNILKKFHDGDAANSFIIAAKAYTPCHYNNAMKDFFKLNSVAVRYVQEIGEHRWSRVEAIRARFTLMTTNISESWNSKLKNAKSLPICHLVDFIRRSLMEWFEEVREKALRWKAPLTPYAEFFLEERWELAKLFYCCRIIGDQYEVIERGINDQHQVNILEKSCTCRVINYEHLPCPHVLAVCEKYKLSNVPLCGDYYQTWKWRSMYAPAIYPALSSEFWNVPESVSARIVLNPNTRRGKGRPKVDRIRCVSEKSSKLSKKRGCSNCHQPGHYATTCPKKLA
ncbi:hypothetical protein MKX03_012640 [Papaver bracteatum]|nr:hypothetical protein MKX03_012640 [Papaver bracteatum]